MIGTARDLGDVNLKNAARRLPSVWLACADERTSGQPALGGAGSNARSGPARRRSGRHGRQRVRHV